MTLEYILAAAEEGATVLTANNRVARALRHGYARRQQERGRAAWPSPHILSWAGWLERCRNESAWAGGRPAAVLLGSQQEQAVWESVIAASPEAASLLQPAAAAREAAKAWELLQAWQLPFPDESWRDGTDSGAFLGWAQEFDARCAREGWLDGARLPGAVGQAILLGRIRHPGRLLRIGFDEFTPQQLQLWTCLSEAGCKVEGGEAAPPEEPERAVRVALASAEEETRNAGMWARRQLERGDAASIGIVVPDLAGRRAALDRIFRQVLDPGSVLPGRPGADELFNLSLGIPLADYPVIHAALLVLALATRALGYEETGSLLRSPYLAGSGEELTRRALLDAELAACGGTHIDALTLERQAARHGCAALAAAMARGRQKRDEAPSRQAPSRWARAFAEWLSAAGWPGERSPDSAEFQTVRAFHELLSRFAALDRVLGPLEAAAAVARVRRMALETEFQPEGPDAPIQILGVFEASGMRFDRLWIMGMHDEAWPAPAHPHPFLPLAVQRRAGLPHSSAERELAFLRRVTARLLASAPEVVVSWPRRAEDQDRRPSPLISALPVLEEAALDRSSVEMLAARSRDSAALQEVVDETAPAVAPGPVHGGAKVFQLQAWCPFRAFAELRLGAGEYGSPEAGLTALERGIVVHAALEALWGELGDSRRLKTAAPERLDAIVRRAADAGVARLRGERELPAWHVELERERLAIVLREWLGVERTRAPFRVATAERERVSDIEGLRVRLRIDRVDLLADGRPAIIDYKTGDPRVRQWLEQRPEEPQVPLYAITSDTPPAALAFARVQRGKMAFVGLAAAGGMLPVNTEDHFDEQLAVWREVLHRLACEFRAGRAEVDPKDPGQTCRYCPLPPLCRIHEQDAREEEEDKT